MAAKFELTKPERRAIHQTLWDTGCMGFTDDHPELFAAVESIVRARVDAALAEVERRLNAEAVTVGDCLHFINAARQEVDQ